MLLLLAVILYSLPVVLLDVSPIARLVLTGSATVALVGVLEGLTSGSHDPLSLQAEPLLALPDGMASRIEEGGE